MKQKDRNMKLEKRAGQKDRNITRGLQDSRRVMKRIEMRVVRGSSGGEEEQEGEGRNWPGTNGKASGHLLGTLDINHPWLTHDRKVGGCKATNNPSHLFQPFHLLTLFQTQQENQDVLYSVPLRSQQQHTTTMDNPFQIETLSKQSLGARTPIIRGHMVNILRIQSISDHNVSSGQKSDTFKMYPVTWIQCPVVKC